MVRRGVLRLPFGGVGARRRAPWRDLALTSARDSAAPRRRRPHFARRPTERGVRARTTVARRAQLVRARCRGGLSGACSAAVPGAAVEPASSSEEDREGACPACPPRTRSPLHSHLHNGDQGCAYSSIAGRAHDFAVAERRLDSAHVRKTSLPRPRSDTRLLARVRPVPRVVVTCAAWAVRRLSTLPSRGDSPRSPPRSPRNAVMPREPVELRLRLALRGAPPSSCPPPERHRRGWKRSP